MLAVPLILLYGAHAHAHASGAVRRAWNNLYNNNLQDNANAVPSTVQTLYWDSFVDHFDGQNPSTFKQRYFIDDSYWEASNRTGPVFICVGGEGPALTASVLTNSVHCSDMVELGAKLGALLLALEHRYYGTSYPTSDFSTESFRYLSAHQALADLAAFRMFITKTYSLDDSVHKWVSWGGSYPGMLAGWFRLKFPNLVHAAVASSAPVKAQVDFQGYFDVVADSMRAEIVGGSDQCADIIAQGHETIRQMLQDADGRTELASLFNICEGAAGLEDPYNQADWAGNGVIYLPVQENDPSCKSSLCNIAKICSAIVNSTKDPLHTLADIAKAQFGSYCMDVSNADYLSSLQDTTLTGGVERIWFYQTCSEFAFYQTCEYGSKCIYSLGLNTIDKQLLVCQQIFNISAEQVEARVDFSNAYWGADHPAGSRVLYPNGQIDPWHYLSILHSDDADLPTIWVPGASHHFWTHTSLSTDSEFVVKAREEIWGTVTRWLSGPVAIE